VTADAQFVERASRRGADVRTTGKIAGFFHELGPSKINTAESYSG
jgi:hypothetical protein